ncbi:hypothetical protein D3C75_1025700 [compost metagenome]
MIVQPGQAAARPLRVSPVGAGHELPAGAELVRTLMKHHRTRYPQRVGQGRVVLDTGTALGMGDIPGGLDEARELGVGDRMHVNPEAGHLGGVRRAFFVVKAA